MPGPTSIKGYRLEGAENSEPYLIVADGALIVWLHLTVRDCNELPDIFQTNYWVRGFLDLVLQPYGDLSSGGLRVLDRNNFQWHHSLSLVPQLLCQGQLRQ